MAQVRRYVLLFVIIFLASPSSPQPLTTFDRVGWASEAVNGNCVLKTLEPPAANVTEYLRRQTTVDKPPPFLEIISRADVYEFRANIPAKDDLQFQIWSAGGYQMLFTMPTGEDVVLTPAISNEASLYLAASVDPRKSIWTLGISFDPKLLILTATAEVDVPTGFRYLIERAEAGVLYVLVPSEIGGASWEVGLGSSFRDALASFIRCNQGTLG